MNIPKLPQGWKWAYVHDTKHTRNSGVLIVNAREGKGWWARFDNPGYIEQSNLSGTMGWDLSAEGLHSYNILALTKLHVLIGACYLCD